MQVSCPCLLPFEVCLQLQLEPGLKIHFSLDRVHFIMSISL